MMLAIPINICPLWAPSLLDVWLEEPSWEPGGVDGMLRGFLIANVPLLVRSCRVSSVHWGPSVEVKD